jgi:hypothetical protein
VTDFRTTQRESLSSNYSNSATLDIFESAETSSSLRFLLTTCMALGRPEKQGPVLSGSDYQVAISDHSSSSSKHTSAVSLSPTVGRRRDCRVAGNPKFILPRKFAATTAEPEFRSGTEKGSCKSFELSEHLRRSALHIGCSESSNTLSLRWTSQPSSSLEH